MQGYKPVIISYRLSPMSLQVKETYHGYRSCNACQDPSGFGLSQGHPQSGKGDFGTLGPGKGELPNNIMYTLYYIPYWDPSVWILLLIRSVESLDGRLSSLLLAPQSS